MQGAGSEKGPVWAGSCPGLPPPCSGLWDHGRATSRPWAPGPSSEFHRSSLPASPTGQTPAQPRSGLSSGLKMRPGFSLCGGMDQHWRVVHEREGSLQGVTLKAQPQIPDRPRCLPSPSFRGGPGWNSRPAHPRGERGDGGGHHCGPPQGQRAYKGSSE